MYREMNMAKTYELFKDDESGKRSWVETVVGPDQLKKRLMKLTALKPATYLVYDPVEAKFVEPFTKSA
jgi:hypothetical protein